MNEPWITSEVVDQVLNEIIDDPTMAVAAKGRLSSEPADYSGVIRISVFEAASSADEALVRLGQEVELGLQTVAEKRGIDPSSGIGAITESLASQALLGERAASGLSRLVELGQQAHTARVDPAALEIVRDRGEMILNSLNSRALGWDPKGP